MTFLQNFSWIEFAFTLLLGEIVILTGNFLYDILKAAYYKRRYGRWSVKVKHPTLENFERKLSPATAQQILEDEAIRSQILKGIVSGYDWLNTDLVTKGVEIGLLTQDDEQRCFIIDFAHNPAKE